MPEAVRRAGSKDLPSSSPPFPLSARTAKIDMVVVCAFMASVVTQFASRRVIPNSSDGGNVCGEYNFQSFNNGLN